MTDTGTATERASEQMPLWLRADLWSGLACATFGGAILWVGSDYPLGSGGRIGPGYAPRLLGIVLAAIGALMIVRAWWVAEPIERLFRPRPVVLVVASVLAFAVVFDRLGLVPAVLASVFVANWASQENGWRSSVAVGVVLALFSWLLFVVALKLPMPVLNI